MAASVTSGHEKIKAFDWEPSYFHRDALYPTKYKIPPRTKDPFRTLVREYVGMEEEKDDRQYGALEDALGRMNNASHAEPRFMEVMKPVLAIVDFGEYAAMKCTAMLVDTVENPELRQGYLAQMIDEVRHTNQEAYLHQVFREARARPRRVQLGFPDAGARPDRPTGPGGVRGVHERRPDHEFP